MEDDFLAAYRHTIERCLKNDFKDNWDERRFGAEVSAGILQRAKQPVKKLLAFLGLFDPAERTVSLIKPVADQYQWVYPRLADDESREVLLQVLSFRALGYRRVKMPLNNPGYWAAVANAERMALKDEWMDLGWEGRRAYKMDLAAVGYHVKLFYIPYAIIYVFVLHQYECALTDHVVKAEAGDVVIDAGGCFGDTALYFAHEVGEKGKVYSFEFLPKNVAVFERNMSLNAELRQRVNLIKMPLWSKSGVPLHVAENGPATGVVPDSGLPGAIQVTSLAIDDMVSAEKLDRVDFIKMDIEGAELESLRGAETTIRRFRPRLAVSVYHNQHDLWSIQRYLDNLGLDYRFALRHFSICDEETVLFAF